MSRREVTRRQGSRGDRSVIKKSFRRGLTIVGTTSENLRGSQSESDSLQSPRTKAHHLSQKRNKIARLLLVIAFACSLLTFLVFQFSSEPVVVMAHEGNSSVSKSEREGYKNAINAYMKSNPASRLQFLMSEQALSEYMSGDLPEVKSVRQLGDGDKIGETVFEIEMRRPVASWVIGDKKYYVDARGVAFERNFFSEPSVEIIDESGISSEDYGVLASNNLLGFVGRVVSLSLEKGVDIQSATLPPDKTRQIDFKIKKYRPIIKMTVDRSARNQVEDMSRAVRHLKKQGTTPRYIDVRVAGKSFYR